MAKKNKIEPGQCYEKADHIYMIVIQDRCCKLWRAQDTLTKNFVNFKSEDIYKMRRPFQNFG